MLHGSVLHGGVAWELLHRGGGVAQGSVAWGLLSRGVERGCYMGMLHGGDGVV